MNLDHEDYACKVCGREMVAALDEKKHTYECPAAGCRARAIIVPNGRGGVLRHELTVPGTVVVPTRGGSPPRGKPGASSVPSGGLAEATVDGARAALADRDFVDRMARARLGVSLGELVGESAQTLARKMIARRSLRSGSDQDADVILDGVDQEG